MQPFLACFVIVFTAIYLFQAPLATSSNVRGNGEKYRYLEVFAFSHNYLPIITSVSSGMSTCDGVNASTNVIVCVSMNFRMHSPMPTNMLSKEMVVNLHVSVAKQ